MSTPPPARRSGEETIQLVIMLAVATMAGAASFTHVHDWTMDNSPEGTGDWFGWANAMVSELIPLAAGLEVRRRRRLGHSCRYPMALIVAAVCLSLAGQFAQAKPGPSGWLIAAVPALGFLALAKLALARPAGPATTSTSRPASTSASSDISAPAPAPADTPPASTDPATPADATPALPPAPAADVPAHLLPAARFAVVQHEQATGRPITPAELAARLNLTPTIAAHLLTALGLPTAPTRVNGAPTPVGVG